RSFDSFSICRTTPRLFSTEQSIHQHVIAACFLAAYVQEFRHPFPHNGMKSAAPSTAIKQFGRKTSGLKCLLDCSDVRSEPIAMVGIELIKPVEPPEGNVFVDSAQSFVAEMCFDKHLIGGHPADVVYSEHRIAQVIKHPAEKDGIKVAENVRI